MSKSNLRKRQALYAGIADAPVPTPESLMDRFHYGYEQSAHSATMQMLYGMNQIMTKLPRRPLPGITNAVLPSP